MNILVAVLNSFWQAAVLAALVWLALRALPGVNASTRYVIWFAALLLLLVLPAVPVIVESLHLDVRSEPIATPARTAGTEVRTPLAIDQPAIVTLRPDPFAGGLRWLLALWAAVALYRVIGIARSYFRLCGVKKRALVTSRPLPATGRRVKLVFSSEIASPMAVGFLHPAVILPESLPDALSPGELDHILLHEAGHLARRDDWSNLAARLLGAVLALHPVATWIARQIEREREIACDDWVVAHTGAARPYAASLARMFELRWAQRNELLASGVLGPASRLSDRIELLLRRRRQFSPRVSLGRVVVGALALVAFAALVSRAPQWIAFAQERPEFAVASVKPETGRPPVSMKVNPDGISFTGVTLVSCIKAAYAVYDFQVEGGDSYRRDEYDIQAKAEGKESKERLMLMLGALLADRFKLVVHTETKELPVFELAVGKGGSKLKASTAEDSGGIRVADGGLKFTKYTMPQLGEFLSRLPSLDRPVLDRTRLDGAYDFTLLIDGQKRDLNDPAAAAEFKRAMSDWGSISHDLQNQLGLKLDSAKAPIERLVIDHAEKPAAN
jgi:uncharacterized protein (TIGR03435 family)